MVMVDVHGECEIDVGLGNVGTLQRSVSSFLTESKSITFSLMATTIISSLRRSASMGKPVFWCIMRNSAKMQVQT